MSRAGTESLDETVRRLRAEGRQRASIGEWHVEIRPNYATFEHEDDRAKRLTSVKSATPARR